MSLWKKLFGSDETKPAVREALEEQAARVPIGYTPESWQRYREKGRAEHAVEDRSRNDGAPSNMYPLDVDLLREGYWVKVPNFNDGQEDYVVHALTDLTRLSLDEVRALSEDHHRRFPHVHTGSTYVLVEKYPNSLFMFNWR
jgi:hypothetical protein